MVVDGPDAGVAGSGDGGVFHVADRLGDQRGGARHGLHLLQQRLGGPQDLRVLIDGRFSQLFPQGRFEGVRVLGVLLQHHRGRLNTRHLLLKQGLQSLIAILDRGAGRDLRGGGGPGGEGGDNQGQRIHTRPGLAA